MAPTTALRTNAVVVPILGMHRSGTSVITRALNLLGLELGKPLSPSRDDNPKGLWENEFFWAMNVRILRAMDRNHAGFEDYRSLAEIPELSNRVSLNPDDLDFIAQYIAESFACPLWGWKDPRSVLLFPFWVNTLTALGFRDIRPVVVVRHPSACVQSLLRRGDFALHASQMQRDPAELGLEMWKAYNRVLEAILDETDSFITTPKRLVEVDDSRGELERCMRYLGLGEDSNIEEALAWMDPSALQADLDGVSQVADAESLGLYWTLVSRAEKQATAPATAATADPVA